MNKLDQLLKLLSFISDDKTENIGDKTENIGDKTENISNDIASVIGKKVIIRSYGSGVHFGTIESLVNDRVTLINSRRIHYWKGANSITDIALGGIKNKEDSRVTATLSSIMIFNVIEIIICTKTAIQDLESFPIWTQL